MGLAYAINTKSSAMKTNCVILVVLLVFKCNVKVFNAPPLYDEINCFVLSMLFLFDYRVYVTCAKRYTNQLSSPLGPDDCV